MRNLLTKEDGPGSALMKRIKTKLASKPEKPKDASNVFIDFPQEGEKVYLGSYTIRLSAQPESEVQASINDGDWQACRNSIGYWWLDWQPTEATRCKIVARCRTGKGRWKKSDPRLCEVI